MIQKWCKRSALIAYGTCSVSLFCHANTAPVAVDDTFTTLEGQAISVGRSLINSSFDGDSEGFELVKDLLGTNNPNFVRGSWGKARGKVGGGLYVKAGPSSRTGTPIGDTSVTWNKSFSLENRTSVAIQIRYRLKMASGYEREEFASAILGINSDLIGNGPSNTLTTNFGNPGIAYDSGWKLETFQKTLNAGEHTIWAGIYSNNSTATNEYAEVFIDDIIVDSTERVGVLNNDTDVDDDRLSASVTKQPNNGLLVFNSNGSFTYTPNPGFSGSDVFQYRAFDGSLNSSMATVTILVDSRPNALPDQFTVNEDNPLVTTSEEGVLKNDYDPEGSKLTATLVNPTENGELFFNEDGSFRYIPSANFHGEDGFSYKISDGKLQSETVAVKIIVNSVDDPAQSTPDSYTTFIGKVLSIDSAHGLLSNDYDPDGTELSCTLATSPQSGALELRIDGSLSYTPADDFEGEVNFTYRLNEADADTPAIPVVIHVEKASPRIVINEIHYHPIGSQPQDEFIELVNTGNLAADLTGWRFSKGISYTFPTDSTLDPGEYLVVTADRANFRTKYPTFSGKLYGNWVGQLSNGGETLQIENAEGKNEDEVTYSDEGNWSRRRASRADRGFVGWIWDSLHDGQGRSLELINPSASNKTGQNWTHSKFNGGTPGYVNSQNKSDVAPFIRDIQHHPTIPTSSDKINISARINDDSGAPPATASLYWRPDGQDFFTRVTMMDDGKEDDRKAKNQVFGAVLPAQPNGTIVEFYIATSDGHNSRTWPAPTDDNGTQAANCLLMVTNESDEEKSAPVYRLVMTNAEQTAHKNADRRSDSMINATFISSFNGDLKARYLAGVRYRGSGSRGHNPPPYRVNLCSEVPWENGTQLNLNPVNFHEQLAGSAISNHLGLPAARATAIDLHINGEHQQSGGKYVFLQPLGSEFIEDTYPDDSNGNLYKGRRSNESPPGGLGSGLVYHPNNPAAYTSYIKLTNSTVPDWSDVIALTKSLNELTNQTDFFNPDNKPLIHNNLVVDQWLRYFALHALISNTEGGLVGGDNRGDDYAMYSGVKDSRFRMVSHDFDSLFDRNTWNIFICTRVPALNKLINHPQLRPRYLAFIKNWSEGFFQPSEFRSFLQSQLRPHVSESQINSMINFMERRTEYVLSNNSWYPTNYLPPPLKTLISNEPPSTTPQRRATLQVSGTNVTHYRYRLSKSAKYDPTIYPVEESITLDNLPDGEYSVYVRGINKAADGSWQYDLNETKSKTWTVKQDSLNIRINEVLASNAGSYNHEGTLPDYIEILNAGTTAVTLEGLVLTDDPNKTDKYVLPAGLILQPGEFHIFHADKNSETSGIHLGFGLDAEGDSVYLMDGVDGDASILDKVSFGLQIPDMSIGRNEELQWSLDAPTPGFANQRVPLQSPWNLKINEWLADGARVFNDDFIEIYNPSPMPVSIGGFYLTDNPVGNPALHRIATNSYIAAKSHIAFLATGKKSTSDSRMLNFKLSSQREAISLLTADLEEVDTILYGPQRTDISQGRTTDGATTITDFALPTPGKPNNFADPNEAALIANLRIVEIMYNPLGGSDFEYIELKNIGDSLLDLTKVRFTNGIEHTFQAKILRAGATLVLANDSTAFEGRYTTKPDGEYSGNLSNGGEKIRLETPTGIGILEFDYSDAWHEDTDGDGFSLEISDENAYPENWDQPDTWRTGRVLHGSPGGSEPSNTPPSDILLTPDTLDRTLNAGDSVGTLTAIDTFPRDTFTFELTGIGTDRFSLQGNDVQLIKATTPSDSGPFQLGLRVSDSYGANFAKVITINLTDNQADNDTDDLPDAWEQSNFGNLTQTGSSDFDGDGQSNILEYLAGTDPTDPAKSFSLQSPSLVDGQFSFTFEALPNRIYQLESRTPAANSWTQETTTIQEGVHTYSLPVSSTSLKFYRISQQ